MPEAGNIALTLGLLLTASLLGGLVAERFRLPKVTAYLLIGLLLGPHTLESIPEAVFQVLPRWLFTITTIPESHLAFLDPAAKFAMALVLFNMGCSFTLRQMRDQFRAILRLSFGELALTFSIVAVGLLVLRESWACALLFGALAMATAPATTVLVLKENQSEGPVTRHANALVALNNIASVVAFEILFVAVLALSGQATTWWGASLLRLVLDMVGSVTVGILSGLVATVGCAYLSRSRWLVMLIAITATILGLCQQFELPYLLTFLIMGITVANASDRAKDIVAQLDNLTGLLCVLFFVIHGTEMDLRALLAAGTLGVGYMVFRSLGKYFGIYLVATRQDGIQIKRWLGATLMSQAGAAIALSSIAAERYPAIGEHLRDIILGTVIVFEIMGPILIRQAVIRAGEVPLSTAIRHHGPTLMDEVFALGRRLAMVFGLQAQSMESLKTRTINDLVRPVRGIPASATFRRVVDFIEQSHDDTLPVIDEANAVIGMISYQELQDTHFDPGLGPLVRAADLAVMSYPLLRPDQSLADAWEEFEHSNADCLPVVSGQRPSRLLGIVRRRDLAMLVPRSSRRG